MRAIGYSVTTTVGYGMEGKERLVLTIILASKQLAHLKTLLRQEGKINMSLKSINKAYGKIAAQPIVSS